MRSEEEMFELIIATARQDERIRAVILNGSRANPNAPERWELLQQTYSDAGYEHTWEALFAMTRLFRQLALPVAERFGFDYLHGDEARITAHLHHVRVLPRMAQEIY